MRWMLMFMAIQAGGVAGGAGTPVVLRDGRQLFVDDYLIDSSKGVARHWNAPTKVEGPILRPTSDDGARVGGCTVATDGGLWWDPTVGWGSGKWDAGYLSALGGICVIKDERLWFYYSALRGDAEKRGDQTGRVPMYKQGMYYNGAIGAATLRRDGFCGMVAGGNGEIVTRPLAFSGAHLFVNAECLFGEVAAEALDADGKAIPGYSAADCRGLKYVDRTKAELVFAGGTLEALKDRQIRLRFKLHCATLYAFWLSPSARGESRGYVAAGGPAYKGLKDMGETPPSDRSPVAEAFAPYADAEDIPGAVSVIAGPDGEVRFDACGYADIGTKRRLTPDSLFWIASNTKAVAAALMLTLVDEGRVSLDDAVEKHLPEFADLKIEDANAPGGVRPPKTKPTVRQVLSHTSGLKFFPQMPIDRYPVRELARQAAAMPQPSDPGAAYQYSNWGIDVAMAIAEVVTGRPWNELLEERILGPLGMKDTTFFPTAEQLSRLAVAYRVADGKVPEAINVTQFQYPYDLPTRQPEAGGGLFSTPRDFMRFLRMLAAGGVTPDGRRILSRRVMEEWVRKQTPECVKNNYSFGMGVEPGARRLSHGGAYQTFGEADLDTGVARLYFVQIAGNCKTADARAKAWRSATATRKAVAAVEGQQAAESNR